MKWFIVFIFLFICIGASTQQVTCRVIDANSGASLPYATVSFKKSNQFLYTDFSGEFSFYKKAEANDDTVTVEYLSYATAKIPVSVLADGFIIKLTPQANVLQTVTVTACNKWKTVTVNKIPGKAKDYIGPGPETRMIIITRFANSKNLTGYIKTIEFYSGSFIEKAQVPVRIHWYKWDNSSNMPGEEITNTSIIVYPYHKGWNKFSVPDRTIYYSHEGVVLGLEFIYPVEYKKQYASLTNQEQRLQWLNDMNHRWRLGMQTTRAASEGCFFIVNNEGIAAYNKKNDYSYLKPAVRVDIEICNQ
jgi:hypothetical protein